MFRSYRILAASALWLTLAYWHACEAQILNDPLNGSTTGTRSGGTFVAGGWQVTDEYDSIFWHVPTVAHGAFQYDIKGLSSGQCPGSTINSKNELSHMYDYTYNNADFQYTPGYREDPYKQFLRKQCGVKNDQMEILYQTPCNSNEDDSPALAWDINTTYTFRNEWENTGSSSTMKTYRNGTLIWTQTHACIWNPAGQSVRIGASTRRGDEGAPVGAVYSNVKMFDVIGQPPPTDNALYISNTMPDFFNPGQTFAVTVTVQNNGTTNWTTGAGSLQYNYGPFDTPGNPALTWAPRTSVGSTVAPGATKTFSFNVTATNTPGTYDTQWRMVHEQVQWFGDILTKRILVQSGSAPVAFNGPHNIPGIVQAEDFDYGGEGVAYHDTDEINNGGQYRATNVDVETAGDTGGGYDVGYINGGEWLKYTVNATSAGNYDFILRSAADNGCASGGRVTLELDGTPIATDVVVPSTGGWQVYTDVTLKTNQPVTAGSHVLRVLVSAGCWNFNYLNVTGSCNNCQTLTIQRGTSGTVRDCYLRKIGDPPEAPGADQANGGIVSGNGTRMYPDTGQPGNKAPRHNLIWFDLSAIPAGSAINSATYSFTLNPSDASAPAITGYKLSRLNNGKAWIEGVGSGTATANNGEPTWASQIYNAANPAQSVFWNVPGASGAADVDMATTISWNKAANGASETISLDVTNYVNGWINGGAQNNGMLMWGGIGTGSSSYWWLVTSEDTSAGTPGTRPKLVIQYAPPAPRHPIAWRSVRNHAGIGDLSIGLDAAATGNSSVAAGGPAVETRGTLASSGTGITRIQVDFDGTASAPNAAAVSVTGYTTTYPGGVATLGSPVGYSPSSAIMIDSDTLEIAFAPPLPDQSCFVISLGLNAIAETVDQSADHDVVVRALSGDATRSGVLNLSDAIWTATKVISGAVLDNGANAGNAVFDYDLNGTIDNTDVQYAKARVSSPAKTALCP